MDLHDWVEVDLFAETPVVSRSPGISHTSLVKAATAAVSSVGLPMGEDTIVPADIKPEQASLASTSVVRTADGLIEDNNDDTPTVTSSPPLKTRRLSEVRYRANTIAGRRRHTVAPTCTVTSSAAASDTIVLDDDKSSSSDDDDMSQQQQAPLDTSTDCTISVGDERDQIQIPTIDTHPQLTNEPPFMRHMRTLSGGHTCPVDVSTAPSEIFKSRTIHTATLHFTTPPFGNLLNTRPTRFTTTQAITIRIYSHTCLVQHLDLYAIQTDDTHAPLNKITGCCDHLRIVWKDSTNKFNQGTLTARALSYDILPPPNSASLSVAFPEQHRHDLLAAAEIMSSDMPSQDDNGKQGPCEHYMKTYDPHFKCVACRVTSSRPMHAAGAHLWKGRQCQLCSHLSATELEWLATDEEMMMSSALYLLTPSAILV